MSMATEDQYHVLAVDDSLIDRKLIERLLRTSSYQVTTVDSGSKALEFLRILDDQANPTSVFPQHHQHEVEVNLIITDYCMPGMTGYDLLKRIKESSSFKDIPVVIMSSENVPSRISRCLEGGAEEFFLKPIQLSDLKRLRPHILKGKLKEQQQQEQQHGLHQQQQEQQQHPIQANTNVSTPSTSTATTTSNTSTATTTSNTSTNTNSNSSNSSNKRKAMDEGLSPERTRQRFSTSSLTVV